MRRDCQASRCSECRAFGHERDECVRSSARVAGRGVNDDYADDRTEEEEAEKAAAPSSTPTSDVTDDTPGTVPAEDSTSPRSCRPPRLLPHHRQSTTTKRCKCRWRSDGRRPHKGATLLVQPRLLPRSPPSQKWTLKRAQRSACSKTPRAGPVRNFDCAN
ncbi:hypothetical protein HPB47_009982 [Ixodes persulcatus]|uniref:Uncharacterized protein n=1 Tax=Ixodes persulcatus TaxID=34615 RepID=A0AC60P0K5_IXOPE|nr:hypothetical protein HPB47_009982 [Ixodes persulcatus]